MDDTISSPARPAHRAARGHRWEQVELRPYKEDERALFKTVSRQILFSDPKLDAELRYFEVEPGGFSTLERHEHMHAVMVLRGRGQCLVGREVRDIELHDLVTVPPWTWHQFRAAASEPLGFLCMVNARRDKPQLPTAADLAELHKDETVARFLGANAAARR
ncbi:MAG: cupin domain-containing protein [Hyphomicrobiales bacterium]|nr:cupin domain-containing protein [Hyphomicrobiales bacterium]